MEGEEAGMVEYAASEERIAKLETELQGAVDQEAETAQRLDRERQRRAALDRQLHAAQEEVTRLRLEEASLTRNALLTEADELLQAARVEAAREAAQVTKQASDNANEMVAIARRESVAIVDAGREEVRALEDDAAQRLAVLDPEHRVLAHRLGVMETLCDELVATLNLVAEISIEELVETQDSLQQLDRTEIRQPPTEPNSKETTSGSAPQGELRESARTQADPLQEAQGEADRFGDETRAEANAQDQPKPPAEAVPESDDDGREELAVVIDDRDLERRRSRYHRWLNLHREDRDSKGSRARQDEAISERLSRVLSLSNGVEGADPEEIEARLRNMSHGTNSK